MKLLVLTKFNTYQNVGQSKCQEAIDILGQISTKLFCKKIQLRIHFEIVIVSCLMIIQFPAYHQYAIGQVLNLLNLGQYSELYHQLLESQIYQSIAYLHWFN
ncbi:Hypothetical_protein [Hexamita inflata]|uniref:Hypothetical_protein n=1 Tax=Hexamita inflata TaxID=28002 RepID=A0AA86Q6X3_9EUKA|nr:Hypothetical protein HINF_LOCUS34674 [Hexamita inflata]